MARNKTFNGTAEIHTSTDKRCKGLKNSVGILRRRAEVEVKCVSASHEPPVMESQSSKYGTLEITTNIVTKR